MEDSKCTGEAVGSVIPKQEPVESSHEEKEDPKPVKQSSPSTTALINNCVTELLVEQPDYITTGVPQEELESRLHKTLSESSDVKLATVKKIIQNELDIESIIKMPSGNILCGPTKAQENTASTQEVFSGLELGATEDDEDDEYPMEEDDTEYKPAYFARQKIMKGVKEQKERVSARPKKSKYDSSEYVLTELRKTRKKVPKDTPKAAEKTAEQTKQPPTKRKRVQGKKSLTTDTTETPVSKSSSSATATTPQEPTKKGVMCILCKYIRTKETPSSKMIECKTCGASGHKSCIEKMPKKFLSLGPWVCSVLCRGIATDIQMKKKPCVSCKKPSSKELGLLVTCKGCNDNYHRTCHSPPIPSKPGYIFRCFFCPSFRPSVDKTYIKNKSGKNDSNDNDSSVLSGEDDVNRSPMSDPYVVMQRVEIKSDHEIDPESESESFPKISSVSSLADRQKESGIRGLTDTDQSSFTQIPDESIPDVSKWTTKQVVGYFQKYFDKNIYNSFLEQDIDGSALKLMGRPDVLRVCKLQGIPLGLSLRVLLHVKRLQLRTSDRRYIWSNPN